MMPVMDGLDSSREIRKTERELGEAPIPIVALTASSSTQIAEEAIEAGAWTNESPVSLTAQACRRSCTSRSRARL